MRLKLPYQKESREYYRRLKKTDVVWQKGMDAMIRAAQGDEDFQTRLERVLKIRAATGELGRSLPPKPWKKEEDVFVGCADDLLLAMFADEAQRRAAAPGSREQSLRYLLDLLYGIPWNHLQWTEGTRKRIEKEIRKILEQKSK
ncbi:MAG: hypothetical protein NZ742_06230 [Acidobacteria bacterium]|nr:hypothetical protein [Acidobacteriota bacterium]MDW7984471.1 hypothetical protein [Acidobacteriota bacterium]